MTSFRNTRQHVIEILSNSTFLKELPSLFSLPIKHVIAALFYNLCDTNDQIKWHSISAFGIFVPKLRANSMEDARIIMRRLIWSLNEESGGIGWGAGEALGEIMSQDKILASEYHRILVSYIHESTTRKHDTFLENQLLRRGIIWGIGKLSQNFPFYGKLAINDLIKELNSKDVWIRGYAAWTLGYLNISIENETKETLLKDYNDILLYEHHQLKTVSIAEITKNALLKSNNPNN